MWVKVCPAASPQGWPEVRSSIARHCSCGPPWPSAHEEVRLGPAFVLLWVGGMLCGFPLK
jgi:hypothetical protein